ncbi:hypothetical protein [Aureibaculum conchae]|uniref:hypothetical protein n=1 Tax=Aureibaculum sp. 2308TA14-22 TaxID=3108392 RepID=UPI00339935F2
MNKKAILITLILFAINVNSQSKIKIAEGGIDNLIGVSEYNIEFDYSNITIANFDSEEEYLKDKMAIREAKEIGSGEKFKKDWFAFRDSLFEPKFIETFNKFFTGKVKIKVGKNKDAKYTILVNTVFVYSGYNVGLWPEESKLKATIYIYETGNPDKIEFRSKENYARGRATYLLGDRIANAYGLLGRRLAAFLRKKMF